MCNKCKMAKKGWMYALAKVFVWAYTYIFESFFNDFNKKQIFISFSFSLSFVTLLVYAEVDWG